MTIIEPQVARSFSIDVVRKLRTAGYEAFWAGGCVRDQLLGRQPKDYDVATNATPDQIRSLFSHGKTLPIGAAFGVISVLGPKAAGSIEVATFRRDGAYSDGRRPDTVHFTTAEEDAQRRDFTINGMFFDPIDERVIDYVDGEADLQKRIVRAIRNPRERIDEDKLRMLRAVRFACVLEFEIESETLEAVRESAEQIGQMSGERISQELRRMFSHSNRRQAFDLLFETKLFSCIFPSLGDQTESAPWRNQTLGIIERLGNASLPLALAAIYRDTFSSQGRSLVDVGSQLKLSKAEVETTLDALTYESTIRTANDADWPAAQRVLIRKRAETILDFATAVASQLGEGADGIAFCRAKMALPESQWNPTPFVDGAELHRLGIHAGPIFREILDAVRDRQLRGELQSKEEALTWLRNRFQI